MIRTATRSVISLAILLTLLFTQPTSIVSAVPPTPITHVLSHNTPSQSPKSKSSDATGQLSVTGEYVLVITKLPFKVSCPDTAHIYLWDLPSGWKGNKVSGECTITEASGAGTVSLQAITFDTDWEAKKQKVVSRTYTTVVTVGTKPPTPVPPGPGPKPPDPPNPDEPPDPFGTTSATPGPLRVLIVFESKESTKLPKEQLAMIYGETLEKYLNDKCAVDPDVASWKAWRIFDKDIQGLEKINPMWKRAMSRPHPALPWIVIGNGKTGYEGPLPATTEQTIALLRKYGG
jgi:hypothetical protein